MKKTITLIAILFAFMAQGQIKAVPDEFKKDTMWVVSERLILSTGAKGVIITPTIDKDVDGLHIKHLIIERYFGNSCTEETKVEFLFQDGVVVELKSWNGHNCQKIAYVKLTEKASKPLEYSFLMKVRFTTDGESYTHTLNASEAAYFPELFKACLK